MTVWILILGIAMADPSSRVTVGGAEIIKIERVEIAAETRKECEEAASNWRLDNFRDGAKAFATCAGKRP